MSSSRRRHGRPDALSELIEAAHGWQLVDLAAETVAIRVTAAVPGEAGTQSFCLYGPRSTVLRDIAHGLEPAGHA